MRCGMMRAWLVATCSLAFVNGGWLNNAVAAGAADAHAMAAPTPDDCMDLAKSAAQVIQRGIDAMGGAPAIEAVRSASFTFTGERAGVQQTGEILVGPDGEFLIQYQTPEGEMKEGFDGKISWHEMCSPNFYSCSIGPNDRMLSGTPLSRLHRIVLELQSLEQPATLAGPGEFEGIQCTVLSVTRSPSVTEVYYFRQDDGRLLLIETTRSFGDQQHKTRHTFEDWVKVGELWLPHRFRQELWMLPGWSETRLAHVEFNVEVAGVFEPPAVVERMRQQGKKTGLKEAAAVNQMTLQELQAALVEIAKARRNATPEKDAELKNRFNEVMRAIRQLRSENPAPAPPADR